MSRRRAALALAGIALALALASSLPYLVAAGRCGPEERFSGILFNAQDTNQYLAWIREAADGAWLLSNRYTAREHPPLLLSPYFTSLGAIARHTGLSPIAVHHGARVASAALLVVLIYFIAHLALGRRTLALAATALASFLGGLGLPLAALGLSFSERMVERPVDFWVPEAFVFQSAYLFPHLLFAQSLMLATIGAFFVALSKRHVGALALAMGAALLLALVHPFDLAVTGATAGLLALAHAWRHRRWVEAGAGLAIVMAPPAALVGLNALLLASHPAYAPMLAQSQTTPGWTQLALGLGLAPALLVAGAAILAWRRWRSGTSDGEAQAPPEGHLWLAVFLLVAILALALLPIFDLRRRFLMGVGIPLAILLVFVSAQLRGCLPRRLGGALVALAALALTAGSPLRPLHDLREGLAKPSRRGSLVHSVAHRELYAWLDANSGRENVALTDPRTGNELPAHTGLRVVLGHWAHTENYRARRRELRAALGQPGGLAEMARRRGADHVVVLHERDAGGRLARAAAALRPATLVFQNESGLVYRLGTARR